MPKPTGQPFTLADAQKAKPGTVVVSPRGVVSQKHGPDRWYIAQDWECAISDQEVVGNTFVTVTKWKVRDRD